MSRWVGGTTVYWEVDSLVEAIAFLVERGAVLYRGPALTAFGAGAAMLKDPFGCTIGLNASTPGVEGQDEGSQPLIASLASEAQAGSRRR